MFDQIIRVTGHVSYFCYYVTVKIALKHMGLSKEIQKYRFNFKHYSTGFLKLQVSVLLRLAGKEMDCKFSRVLEESLKTYG